MKRLLALLTAVLICMTLVTPPVLATPYDPLNPHHDGQVVGGDDSDEADPWGELQLTGEKGNFGFTDLSLWWETTLRFFGNYLLGGNFQPPVIIIIKQTSCQNEENGTMNEDQNTQNTNPRPGVQTPSNK